MTSLVVMGFVVVEIPISFDMDSGRPLSNVQQLLIT